MEWIQTNVSSRFVKRLGGWKIKIQGENIKIERKDIQKFKNYIPISNALTLKEFQTFRINKIFEPNCINFMMLKDFKVGDKIFGIPLIFFNSSSSKLENSLIDWGIYNNCQSYVTIIVWPTYSHIN
jgi:hypothetical protein